MATIRGNKTLSGSWAEVWIDGVKAFLLQKIELKVEANREDVQIGNDVDSKMTGLKGSGTISVKKVYTMARKMIEDLASGKDVRCSIITKLQDPDAVDGQIERWSVDNVWWNTIPVVSWETGTPVQEEYEIGFTPSDLVNMDEISAA